MNLYRLDLGFDRDHLLAVWINPRLAGYTADELPLLYNRLIARVEAVPGVRSAAISMCGLVSECRSTSDGFEITGYTRRPGEEISLQENLVGSKYFQTVGIGLLEGRDFDIRDSDRSPRVAIINEAAVRRFFGNRRAVGQRIRNSAARYRDCGCRPRRPSDRPARSRRAHGLLSDSSSCRLRTQHRRPCGGRSSTGRDRGPKGC